MGTPKLLKPEPRLGNRNNGKLHNHLDKLLVRRSYHSGRGRFCRHCRTDAQFTTLYLRKATNTPNFAYPRKWAYANLFFYNTEI